MKKIIALLLVVILSFSIVACGNNADKNKSTNDEAGYDNMPVVAGEVSTEAPTEAHKIDTATLKNTYKIPDKNVSINTPSFIQKTIGNTEFFLDGKTRYVSLTYNVESSAKTTRDAYDQMLEKFRSDNKIANGVKEINVKSSGYKTINLVGTYFVEGTIKYNKNPKIEYYMVAYSTVVEGVPILFFGSVSDMSQSEDLKNSVKSILYDMVYSTSIN